MFFALSALFWKLKSKQQQKRKKREKEEGRKDEGTMSRFKVALLWLFILSVAFGDDEEEAEPGTTTFSDPITSAKYAQVETANMWFREFEEFDLTYPLSDGITAEQASQFKQEWEETHNHTSLMALSQAYLFGNDEIEPNLPVAIEYITEGVKLGIPRAHALMGFLIATGRIPGESDESPSDLMSRAVVHYKFAEVADDKIGIAVMAYKSRFGRGVPRSCRKAAELYSILSEQMALSQPDEMYYDFPGPFTDISKVVLWTAPSEYTRELYLQHLEAAGRTGNADVLGEYGRYYMLSGTEDQNFVKANAILQEAVEGGSADAKAHLGYLYQYGLGVDKDVQEALKLYKEAAAENSTVGLTLLGRLYARGDDPIKQDVKKGVEYLEKSIAIPNKDHTMARLELGDIYRDGRGDIPKNKGLAIDNYSKATFGSKAALHELGVLQIDDNCEFAVTALKSAAEFGYTYAILMDQAYRFFYDGQLAKSLIRYELVAEMGNDVAQTNAAFMYLYDFSGDEFASSKKNNNDDVIEEKMEGEEDEEKRKKFAEEEREREENERLARKYKYCFYYYKARAQQDMTNNNLLVLTDSTKDIHQGDSFVRLGDLFYYGNGVKQNYTVAAGFYKHIANHNSQAAFNLGYMYQFGIGVPQDLYMAKRMYDNSNRLVRNRLATWPALIMVFAMHCYSYCVNNPDVALMILLGISIVPLLYYRHFREMKYVRVSHGAAAAVAREGEEVEEEEEREREDE